MADTYTVKGAKSGGKASIDTAMAAFAALSVGFAGYAMPADVFQGLFGPSAAAAPDSSARYVAAAGAAAVTFALIFALLRALGRIPSAKRRKSAEIPADPPRLRRADAHPDAPARWPVSARHELGDPIPAEVPEAEAAPEAVEEAVKQPVLETAEETAPEEERSLPGLLGAGLEISEGQPVERHQPEEAELDHPLPSFIAPVEEAPVEEIEAAPEPALAWDERAPAPVVEEIPVETEEEPVAEAPALVEEPSIAPAEAEPAQAVEQEPVAEAGAPVIEEAAAPAAEEVAPPEPQPVVDELGEAVAAAPEELPIVAMQEPEEAPLELSASDEVVEAAEEQPVVEEAPAPAQTVTQEEPIEALAARIPELPKAREESVSQLMGRLEVGLGRSDRARWLGQSEPESVAPTDDRLKNAIGMLRKMARKS